VTGFTLTAGFASGGDVPALCVLLVFLVALPLAFLSFFDVQQPVNIGTRLDQ